MPFMIKVQKPIESTLDIPNLIHLWDKSIAGITTPNQTWTDLISSYVTTQSVSALFFTEAASYIFKNTRAGLFGQGNLDYSNFKTITIKMRMYTSGTNAARRFYGSIRNHIQYSETTGDRTIQINNVEYSLNSWVALEQLFTMTWNAGVGVYIDGDKKIITLEEPTENTAFDVGSADGQNAFGISGEIYFIAITDKNLNGSQIAQIASL